MKLVEDPMSQDPHFHLSMMSLEAKDKKCQGCPQLAPEPLGLKNTKVQGLNHMALTSRHHLGMCTTLVTLLGPQGMGKISTKALKMVVIKAMMSGIEEGTMHLGIQDNKRMA